jgi:hypothetical protein
MLYKLHNIMSYLKATAGSSSSHLAMSQKLRVPPVGSRMLKMGAFQFTIMSCIIGKTLERSKIPSALSEHVIYFW